jgi:predicted nucleic acid-binding protein
MSLVLDSSATLAWIFDDETTESIRRVFDAVAEQGAFVPSLWRLEVANSLTIAVRGRRIDRAFRQAALADLGEFEVFIDNQTDSRAWNSTLDLADRFRLSLYDAAYVELAQRRALPLATLDEDMRNAGAKLGLELLGVN